jgi:DNA-binding PadR family transcriptional regulator
MSLVLIAVLGLVVFFLYRSIQRDRERDRHLILSILLASYECYGNQFMQISPNFDVGTLYPTLRSMEREGLLESREDYDIGAKALEERGNRPRVMYRLTAKGQRLASRLSNQARSH